MAACGSPLLVLSWYRTVNPIHSGQKLDKVAGKSEIIRLLGGHAKATGKAGFLCLYDGLPLKGQDFSVYILETCTRHVEVFAYVDIFCALHACGQMLL
jgi:hypothetical protein